MFGSRAGSPTYSHTTHSVTLSLPRTQKWQLAIRPGLFDQVARTDGSTAGFDVKEEQANFRDSQHYKDFLRDFKDATYKVRVGLYMCGYVRGWACFRMYDGKSNRGDHKLCANNTQENITKKFDYDGVKTKLLPSLPNQEEIKKAARMAQHIAPNGAWPPFLRIPSHPVSSHHEPLPHFIDFSRTRHNNNTRQSTSASATASISSSPTPWATGARTGASWCWAAWASTMTPPRRGRPSSCCHSSSKPRRRAART